MDRPAGIAYESGPVDPIEALPSSLHSWVLLLSRREKFLIVPIFRIFPFYLYGKTILTYSLQICQTQN
jgi:hypothetical protein